MVRSVVFKISIVGIILIALLIGGIFYFFQSKNTTSPISKESKIEVASKNQPSKTLKEYIDDSGFSFNFPEDVKLEKKEISDSITYANLELSSTQVKGSIAIKIVDTKLASIDDWFVENNVSTSSAAGKNIKLDDLSGLEVRVNSKLMALALDKGVLFTIELVPYDQKYWQEVYNTILSSFAFARNQPPQFSESTSSDTFSEGIVLEEEILE